jgi:hypothetical protein
LRASYPTISHTGGFSDAHLVFLATTLDQDLLDYVGHDVEFVSSSAASPAATTPRMACLQIPTPDALTRPSETNKHLQRAISRTIKARAFLDVLIVCGPSPDYMRVISGTGRGALAIYFSFRVPCACYMMAAHRVLGLTPGYASHNLKFPRCNESPGVLRALGSSPTASSPSMFGERSPISILMDHIPRCPCSHYVIRLHDLIVLVLEKLMAEAGAIRRRDFRL